ncbi:MAG: hypothetical protein ACLFUW_01405 [Bacteroidales bacterium]
MRIKTFILINVFLVTTISFSLGQKNTFSPYSRYGFGEMVNHSFTTHKGMGGTNTAVRIPNQVNYQNPASYTVQDTNSFIFDAGLKGGYNSMQTDEATINKKTAGFDYLAIGFPITNWWKASSGIVPYTNVGYDVVTKETYDDGLRHNYFQGTGGLRKFYIGSAFQLHDNLSIGLNYAYLFGTLNYNSIIVWETDSAQIEPNNFIKENEKIVRASQINLGFQYTNNLNANTKITIGGSYEHSLNFDYSESQMSTNTIDTLSYAYSKKYNFPSTYALGIALTSEKLTWGADFSFTEWSNLKDISNIQDSYSIQTGLEYTPDKEATRSYLRRINYRAGGFYRSGYLNIENNDINNFGITFGLGLPIKQQRTKFNIAVELGKKGTVDNNLVESNYANINFGITFYDIWFLQRKYQ